MKVRAVVEKRDGAFLACIDVGGLSWCRVCTTQAEAEEAIVRTLAEMRATRAKGELKPETVN